jgi:hypothetical protein
MTATERNEAIQAIYAMAYDQFVRLRRDLPSVRSCDALQDAITTYLDQGRAADQPGGEQP